jgi:hypothetical protein
MQEKSDSRDAFFYLVVFPIDVTHILPLTMANIAH